MWPTRYWNPRYWAARFFANPGGATAAPGARYFTRRYWAARYFPDLAGAPTVGANVGLATFTVVAHESGDVTFSAG